MNKDFFFFGSVLSYFYLERFYGLGIIISFVNFVAMSTVPGIMPIGLAFIVFLVHVGLVAFEQLQYANIAFLALAVLYPFFSKMSSSKNIPPKANVTTTIDTNARSQPPTKPPSVVEDDDEDEDEDNDDTTEEEPNNEKTIKSPVTSPNTTKNPIIQKAIDNARKREQERKELAKQRALQRRFSSEFHE